MVYKIIKYAIRHKHPQYRSAFTYCEDELPSRIDFGKNKYGGPFTIEQVEDVKTFLRVLPLAIVGGALIGSVIASDYLRNKLNKMFLKHGDSESEVDLNVSKMSIIKCSYSEASFTHTIYYSAILLIVLHETLFYPIFHRCLPQLESLQKAFIGMLLQLVRIFILMAYEIVAQHNYSVQSNNITTPCLFYAHQGTLSSSFDYHWMAIPDFIVSISNMMLYIGAVEYFSAQVPYFMKGLTVGVTFSSVFLSGAVLLILSIPFTTKALSYTPGPVTSCGFWYGLLLTVVETIVCIILIILTRWYKKRRRQDVLPNEHIFAERYYSTFT